MEVDIKIRMQGIVIVLIRIQLLVLAVPVLREIPVRAGWHARRLPNQMSIIYLWSCQLLTWQEILWISATEQGHLLNWAYISKYGFQTSSRQSDPS